ncbi:MAG: hypothetical protein FWC94_01965 [Bacteroidales bacterium]|nr:hypothetical protein [Bacteroidales bacterium]
MKFCVLPESEMLQKAKEGNRSYLDLLLSSHELFLLHHLSKITKNPKELLDFRHTCIDYAHVHFCTTFDEQAYPVFSTWLLECVINEICPESSC